MHIFDTNKVQNIYIVKYIVKFLYNIIDKLIVIIYTKNSFT